MSTFEEQRDHAEVCAEVRMRLQEAFGDVRGRNLYRVLCEAVAHGGWPLWVAPRTRRRHMAQLRSVGIHSLNMEDALAELRGHDGDR